MLKKKIADIAVCLVLAVLLLSLCGCAGFRKLFSPSASRMQDRSERQERSAQRDPVKDMFRVKNKPDYMESSSLSAEEKAIVRSQMYNSDEQSLTRDIRRGYDQERKKRQEWVFGKNPFNKD